LGVRLKRAKSVFLCAFVSVGSVGCGLLAAAISKPVPKSNDYFLVHDQGGAVAITARVDSAREVRLFWINLTDTNLPVNIGSQLFLLGPDGILQLSLVRPTNQIVTAVALEWQITNGVFNRITKLLSSSKGTNSGGASLQTTNR
jgi:hypothetical protein